jgi:uncharacterized protein (DUF983 family)
MMNRAIVTHQPTFGARLQAILHERCPRCLEGAVFKGTFTMRERCGRCGLVFGREEGYFTGAMIVSYCLAWPLLGAVFFGGWAALGWPVEDAFLLGIVLLLAATPFLFRYSRVVWMHFDRAIDPGDEEEPPPAGNGRH